MILDGVVCAAFENFGDLSPLVAVVSMHQVENPLLLAAPANLLDLRVQVIVPPLAALLPNTTREVLSNQRPFLGPIFIDEVKNHSIFLFGPGTFDEARIQNLLPSMKALNVCAAW